MAFPQVVALLITKLPEVWGMATQMYNRAKEITPGLRHSDNRTDAGQGWAKSVGGPLPERVQDHPEWMG